MTAGVGVFGAFSGFVAAWFLRPTARKNRSEIEMLRREIGELRAMLEPSAEAAAGRRGPTER
jgi:hypothetical protein